MHSDCELNPYYGRKMHITPMVWVFIYKKQKKQDDHNER